MGRFSPVTYFLITFLALAGCDSIDNTTEFDFMHTDLLDYVADDYARESQQKTQV